MPYSLKRKKGRGWTDGRPGLYSWAAVAGAAIGVVGGAINSSNSKSASGGASDAISQGNTYASMVQQQQFAKVQALLAPYVSTGAQANAGQADLLGLNGVPQQQFAIDQLTKSPRFTGAKTFGENAILSNASATGGLRGGNVQGALGQFDENLVGQIIQEQFANLGGISSLGENAAAGTGNAAIATGNQMSALAQNAGVAQAGGILGQASAANGGINAIVNGAGTIAGRLASSGGAGNPPPAGANPGFEIAPTAPAPPVQGFE